MSVVRRPSLTRYKSHSFIRWLNTYCASEIRDFFNLKDSSDVPGPHQYVGPSDTDISPYVLKCNTEQGFIEASANLLLHKITERLNESFDSIALVGFSGGSTPLKIFERLSELQDFTIDVSRIYVFIVDERYTKNLAESNCAMVRRTFISPWQIPESNVIFPNLDLPIEECVLDYQSRLSPMLAATPPCFVTLGIGVDGHIAGLFPEYIKGLSMDELTDRDTLVIRTETTQFACRERLTVTLPVLMSSKTKIFFIKGQDKYACWKEANNAGLDVKRYPATFLFTRPGCICVFDSSGCRSRSKYSSYPDDYFLSVVIFGSNGNLSRRRLYPALFHLFYCDLLPENFKIVSATRSRIDFDDFFFLISEDIFSSILTNVYMCNPAIRFDFPTSIEAFRRHCTSVKLVYDGSHVAQMESELERLEGGFSSKRLFYLATPSSAYRTILDLITRIRPTANHGSSVMLEKPFGRSLGTCIELTETIGRTLTDNYVVDHYIGKAVLKFILSVRTSPEYSRLFDRSSVGSIHVELLEDDTVERRPYFEGYGIVRDMVQNHVMILLSYLTMSLDSVLRDSLVVGVDNPRDKFHFNHEFPFHAMRLRLLRDVQTVSLSDVVLGQYVSDGYSPGFRDTLLDDSNSNCPTYVTLRLSINNDQWGGVPIVITCGKGLRERVGRITIRFKSSEIGRMIFVVHPRPMAYWVGASESPESTRSACDELLFFDRPCNQIPLPGVAYKDLMKPIAGAYENVLLNALWGYRHLFPTIDEVIECWRIYDSVLGEIDASHAAPFEYVRGGDGPRERERIHRLLEIPLDTPMDNHVDPVDTPMDPMDPMDDHLDNHVDNHTVNHMDNHTVNHVDEDHLVNHLDNHLVNHLDNHLDNHMVNHVDEDHTVKQ